jgi:hypothetical protein
MFTECDGVCPNTTRRRSQWEHVGYSAMLYLRLSIEGFDSSKRLLIAGADDLGPLTSSVWRAFSVRSPGWACSPAVKPVTLGVRSTDQLAGSPGATSFELTAAELEEELECLDEVSMPVLLYYPHGNAGADQRQRAIDVSV